MEEDMNLNQMMDKIKQLPEYPQAGMIASHLGIVRGHSLNGKTVTGMEVSFNHDIIKKIIYDTKLLDGIIEVLVDICEGPLKVGDEVMAVAVAGDTREHVFPALEKAVERIKSEATEKKEFFA
jgi:molybdopterin synthase catalytic subunit